MSHSWLLLLGCYSTTRIVSVESRARVLEHASDSLLHYNVISALYVLPWSALMRSLFWTSLLGVVFLFYILCDWWFYHVMVQRCSLLSSGMLLSIRLISILSWHDSCHEDYRLITIVVLHWGTLHVNENFLRFHLVGFTLLRCSVAHELWLKGLWILTIWHRL